MILDQIEDKSVVSKEKFRKTWKRDRSNLPGLMRVSVRTCLALGVMSLVASLSGCMIVDAPIKGVLGTEVTWGDIATGETSDRSTLKEGKACAESILGLLARGDASVRAAKQNGNITEVTSVDHSARNFLNVVGEWCTIVRGQ
ncbi:MAG: TRL-like family protein [Methylothermaceae bacterium]|nr:TRL-like family protein [Methylothermaceae bacterium]